MNICDTFKRLSLDTWDTIRKSRQGNFQLKEETFTDLNMLELKLKHPHEVNTKVFTKPEEGKNGADWEWWFKKNTKWIGFRVQAKILNIYSNELEHLHYQNPNTKVFQCDKLIRNALNAAAPKIPIYCLYIQTDSSNLLKRWTCISHALTKDLWGCALLSAFVVQQLRTANQKHLQDVELFIKPWHCLVCCSGFGGNDSIENLNNYAKVNFDLNNELASELEVVIPENFITEKPPEYVLNILINENNENIIPPDKDIDGVMIYDFDREMNK